MEPDSKKFPEPLEALLLVLGVFGALIALIILRSLFNTDSVGEPDTLIEGSRYFYIYGGSLFLIIPLLYARSRKYPIRNLFRLNPVPLSVILISIPIGIALTIVGDELDRLIALIITVPGWVYEMMYPLKAEGPWDWFLIITGAVVIAAVAEEVLFRGFLQVSLERKGDVTRAVLLSSLTWTLVHQNPYWAVEIFILGIFIGFLAWRSNSIIPPIIVHAINNFIGVWLLNTEDLSGLESWYLWNDHVSPVIIVLAIGTLVWGLRWVTHHYREG